jgi:hypothetical protein
VQQHLETFLARRADEDASVPRRPGAITFSLSVYNHGDVR